MRTIHALLLVGHWLQYIYSLAGRTRWETLYGGLLLAWTRGTRLITTRDLLIFAKHE